MKNLKYAFNNAMCRKLIAKMGELAASYKEPYDDRDMEAHKHNENLKVRWEIYAELLGEVMEE